MAKTSPRPIGFTISQLARELGISTRSIRYYEEKGLIAPRRTRGNQRIYGKRDRARLKLILRGKRFGYSLDEIAEMIGLTDVDMAEREQIQRSLAYGDKKLSEIRERIAELQQMASELTDLREKLHLRLREIEEAESSKDKAERNGRKTTQKKPKGESSNFKGEGI